MSQAHVYEWDELRTCPYDKSHRVRAIKFANHLVKCGRNCDSSNQLQVCPFNALHRFPEIERAHHMYNCPDRVILEREAVSASTKFQHLKAMPVNTEPVPVYNYPEMSSHAPKEDWDAECVGMVIHKYDPEEAMSRGKFRNQATFSGMKPAEKKQYRKMLFAKNASDSAESPMSKPEEGQRNLDDLDDGLTQYRIPKNPNPLPGLSMQNKPTNSVVQVGLARGRATAIPPSTGAAEKKFTFGRGPGLARSADPIRSGADANANFDARKLPPVTKEQFEDADLTDRLSNLRFKDKHNDDRPFMAE